MRSFYTTEGSWQWGCMQISIELMIIRYRDVAKLLIVQNHSGHIETTKSLKSDFIILNGKVIE